MLYLGATEIHSKTTGSTVKTWSSRFYAADAQVIAVRSTETGANTVSFLAGDSHGTSSLAVDAAGQTVTKRYTTPFGAPRGNTVGGEWPDDKGFLGKPADETTGLTYVGARAYDPLIGRFLSVDPVLSTDQSQSLNGYSYGNNNPATFSDPTGEEIGSRPNSCQYDLRFCSKKVQKQVGYNPKTHKVTPPKHHPKKPKLRPRPSPGPSPKPPPGGCYCKPVKRDNGVNLLKSLLLHPFHSGNNTNGANLLAVTYHALPALSDGICERRSLQYVCYGGSPGGDQPMTVGDVHFYPYSKKEFQNKLREEKQARDDITRVAGRKVADQYGPNLEKHEAVHSEQWSRYSRATDFLADYAGASIYSKLSVGDPAVSNRFEMDANLWWGSYLRWAPLHYGPVQ